MFINKVIARVSRTIPKTTFLFSSPQKHHFPLLANQFHTTVCDSPNKLVPFQVSLFHHHSTLMDKFRGISFSASSESSEKEHQNAVEKNNGVSANGEPVTEVSDQSDNSASEQSKGADQLKESRSISESQSTMSHKSRKRGTKRTAFSDSDSESKGDLTMEDLVKLVAEKEELLNCKHKEVEKMKDKLLRSLADSENAMNRTKREAEKAKKFAIQNFAKRLLDVADNLERASSVVRESFSKIDASKDSTGAVPLLKTLLEGVEMTEKQLAEVFKNFDVKKFDPTNEPFDPNRHNAIFQLRDDSKDPGTVAVVLKPGYMLCDRVIRPAEVGVTQAVGTEEDASK